MCLHIIGNLIREKNEYAILEDNKSADQIRKIEFPQRSISSVVLFVRESVAVRGDVCLSHTAASV